MTDERFGEIISQYEKLIYTVCYQFTQNHHTAQDLAQETFISAYNHRESCPEESMKPWLARIATNKAKDFLKSAYNRKIGMSADGEMPENKQVMFVKEEQPEDITISNETLQQIKDEIESLKEPYRKVSVLFFIEEKSVDEIARIVERPPKTVHTQIYRAKNILKERIKEVSHGAV